MSKSSAFNGFMNVLWKLNLRYETYLYSLQMKGLVLEEFNESFNERHKKNDSQKPQ